MKALCKHVFNFELPFDILYMLVEAGVFQDYCIKCGLLCDMKEMIDNITEGLPPLE